MGKRWASPGGAGPPTGQEFREWLRREMTSRRLSQRGLAHLAGIDHSAISRILAGREPTLRTAHKLMDAMNGEHPLESAARRVEAALRDDPAIGEADRAALMREYVRRRRSRLMSLEQRAAGEERRRSA